MRDGSDAASDPSALRARALGYSARGNYSRAERGLLKALRNLHSPGSRPTPDHLFLWNDLGMVYKYAGRFNQAETCYRKALGHSQRCLKGLQPRLLPRGPFSQSGWSGAFAPPFSEWGAVCARVTPPPALGCRTAQSGGCL